MAYARALLELRAIPDAVLAAMPERQFDEAAHSCNVFARVAPEQKLKLVRALQARGEIVGELTVERAPEGHLLRARFSASSRADRDGGEF